MPCNSYGLLCSDMFNILISGETPVCLGENDVVKGNPLILDFVVKI